MEGDPRTAREGEPPPRFLADAMLGRLARWLRILGYDAEYFPGEDEDLLRRARSEGRILLSRDTRLLQRGPAGIRPVPGRETDSLPPHLFIESDHVMAQLRQVVAALGLNPASPPVRRCTCCNVVLEPRDKAQVAGLVPEFVWSHHQAFWACPRCQRIYWAGTHRRRMDEAIRALGP
jgi:uncharacterized protein with PIN domain